MQNKWYQVNALKIVFTRFLRPISYKNVKNPMLCKERLLGRNNDEQNSLNSLISEIQLHNIEKLCPCRNEDTLHLNHKHETVNVACGNNRGYTQNHTKHMHTLGTKLKQVVQIIV
jgi:hypothetical protein